jgi:glucose-1-phosphate cytidylyltransferase
MKAVILAGGLGTRISEESHLKPKPMIEVGGMPILWHILKIYGSHNINEFVICCGYKGYIIKEYFANYFLHMSDVTIDVSSNTLQIHRKNAEPWKITLVNTGQDTLTGGRIKRVSDYVDDTFCLTYGDGVSDVDIGKLVSFHKSSGLKATVTAIRPQARFGSIEMADNLVTNFSEKPKGDGIWINGGFFVCEPEVFDSIDGDDSIWEKEPLERLVSEAQLGVYRHTGFWSAMDTLRDKNHLEELWSSGEAPWKIWK